MRNGKPVTRLTLAEAREKTPAVNAVEALRNNFQLCLLQSVTDLDIKALVESLKTKALGGDLKAMKLLLDLVCGQSKAPAQMNQVVVVDSTGTPLPILPTAAFPGTVEKLEAMQRRVEMGEACCHPEDANHKDD